MRTSIRTTAADITAALKALTEARKAPRRPYRSWPVTNPDREGDPDHDPHAFQPQETDE